MPRFNTAYSLLVPRPTFADVEKIVAEFATPQKSSTAASVPKASTASGPKASAASVPKASAASVPKASAPTVSKGACSKSKRTWPQTRQKLTEATSHRAKDAPSMGRQMQASI